MAPREDEQPSEQSPLLGSQSQAVNSHPADAEGQPTDAQDDADGVVLVEVVSNKKLFAILVTMFIGVFFAALGKCLDSHGGATSLTSSRHHSCRHAHGAHLLRV